MAFNLLFNLVELRDLVYMTLALGYIFKDVFVKQHRHEDYDPIKQYQGGTKGIYSDNFIFAIMITAPAIILHELGHKFVAMSTGATAVFHASYTFLAIAVILKMMNSGFIFFAPAYVAWSGHVNYFQASLIAFAGPFVNLVLWIAAWIWLKYFPRNKLTRKYSQLLVMTKYINMMLFIFNMIPLNIFGFSFDGYQVFAGLLKGFGFF